MLQATVENKVNIRHSGTFSKFGIGWESLLLCGRFSVICFVQSAQTEIGSVCAELLFRKRSIYLLLFYVFPY